MERPRFELEWVPPQELGLMTHVTLFDEERTASYALAGDVLAMGHGVDEADTLLDRWTTLVDLHAPLGAIAFDVAAYRRRIGREPSDRPIQAAMSQNVCLQ